MNSRQNNVLRTAAALLCAAGLVAGTAQAQDQTAPPPPPPNGAMQGPPPGGHGGRGRGGMMDVDRLTRMLALTPDQQTQAKAIFDAARSKGEALRSNEALSQQDRRAQMMAIHEEANGKFKALLTPDQKNKYAEIEARQRERMAGHREGGQGQGGSNDAAPPPPPPQ